MKTLAFAIIACVFPFEGVSQSGLEMPELSESEYRALRIAERSSQRTLPDLSYWGGFGQQWDSLLPKPPQDHAPDTRQLCGLSCRQYLIAAVGSNTLQGIRYVFAAGVTNRQERLLQFQRLKTELAKVYSSPTHIIKEDEIVRGTDAYVQGLDSEYRLEWWGSETIVSLILSDAQLILQFSQAPTSRVRERVRTLKQAEEKQKLIHRFIQEMPAAQSKARVP